MYKYLKNKSFLLNSISSIVYYKITNKDEIHHGYQYKDGLNVLNEKFNENKTDEYGKGGFYFTDAPHINQFYNYGENLRVIELPLDISDFKMETFNGHCRANMIIFKEKYNFNSVLWCNLD